jgi:hypothetical protein
MPSNLTTLAGANFNVPLIPAAHEPAFCTASTSSIIYMWNQSKQLIGYYNTASGEFYNSTNWNGSWSSTPSSNSTFSIAGTSQAGPHGHNYLSITPGFDTNNRSTIYYTQGYQVGTNYLLGSYNQRSTGLWVNKTKRDNLCIQRINGQETYLWRTQVSTLGYGALMTPMTSTGTLTGGTAAGLANGYTTNVNLGLVGYNETTQWWINGDVPASGSTCTLYLYKNIAAPSMTTNLDSTYWDQFNNSTKITITFTHPNSQGSSLDFQCWRILPLDNGNIVIISKTNGSTINYTLLTGNNGLNSTTWTVTNPGTNSTTTSYNNTWQENMPTFVTNDGKYVVVYTQYYYYYSGWIGFIIRVSDGSCRKITHSDTSYSYNSVMLGDNKMIISYGTNSDGGTGQVLYEYDIGYLFDAYTSNFQTVTSYYTTTYIDNPSASTTYPMIWTVPSLLPRFNKGVI